MTTTEEIKSCCSDTYGGEAARFLLGDTFHPGGTDLTRRMLGTLRLAAGATLVDVGSGPGTSAVLAARELGCEVVGVDLSAENVSVARAAAARADVSDRARFVQGDAESLPLADACADAALCECALCLFPDKRAAAAELSRVLRPGGRLALSDVTADPRRLPAGLTTLAAWAACVADARPLSATAALLETGGFEIEHVEAHDELVLELVERVRARLRLARMLGERLPEQLVGKVEAGLELAEAAREAIAAGVLGYGVLIARRRDPA
jgi:hypothetical protein